LIEKLLPDEPSQKKHLDALLVHIQAASLPWIFPRQAQLGLYYLAQHATDKGYKVLVDNLSSNDHLVRRLTRLLNEHNCRFLGFYVDQDNLWIIRRITPSLKKLRPDLNIVLGGPQITTDPEFTLTNIPEAICGVVGEGEETFVEMLSLPQLNSETLKNCRGVIINNHGTLIRNKPRELIDPLDRLSIPQRKKLSIDQSTISPTMITGRGCVGHCAFCFEGSQHNSSKKIRLHSVERSLEEFDYLVREFGRNYITIVDDSFVTNVDRLKAFCKEVIAKYSGKVMWFCESRVDILAKNPDLLPLMIEAGLIRIQVGGESGNQHILDVYRKGTTLEQMYTVVESAKKNGLLSLYANFIIGGAFETKDTYQKTKDFAFKLLDMAPGCMEVGSSFYTPYPGTQMFENPENFGIEVIDREVITGPGDEHAFCRTKDLSRFDILELKFDFERSVKQKMKELSRRLPRETIKKHFQAYHDWNLETDWCEVLSSENQGRYAYFKATLSGGAKNFEEVKAQDFSEVYPWRTVDLVTSEKGKYVIRTLGGGVSVLDALESMILELSTGKLSFDDIIKIVNEKTPGVSLSEIRKACIERYETFDKDCLVVWRTNV
jgi:anaerobic magnesium-protoporphyrin IX monomethyl ester cyclase